jgi:hypothetical protein
MLIGLATGVTEFRNKDIKKTLEKITYLPVIFISFFSFQFVISLFGEPEGIFYGGYKMAFAPLVLILLAFVFSESWRRVKKIIPISNVESKQVDSKHKVVEDPERRRLLSGASLSIIPFLAYGIYGKIQIEKRESETTK